MKTIYGGRLASTSLLERDEHCDLFCPSDECPAFEAEPDAEPPVVRRVAWDGRWVEASGPRYDCAGEPGYHARADCPECAHPGAML